jgi:hypothetical protein
VDPNETIFRTSHRETIPVFDTSAAMCALADMGRLRHSHALWKALKSLEQNKFHPPIEVTDAG